jgi:hypothetical protein
MDITSLIEKLSNLVKDPNDKDPAPLNQKGTVNGYTGKALVSL